MKKQNNILKMAALMSFADIKRASDASLVSLILSRHYMAGMAGRELASRLCRN